MARCGANCCATASSGRTVRARTRMAGSTRIARRITTRPRPPPSGQVRPCTNCRRAGFAAMPALQRVDFLAIPSWHAACNTGGMKPITVAETFAANPIVTIGPTAQRLLDEFRSTEASDDRIRALLERALTAAAAAEDRIAEQNRRIAFLEGL